MVTETFHELLALLGRAAVTVFADLGAYGEQAIKARFPSTQANGSPLTLTFTPTYLADTGEMGLRVHLSYRTLTSVQAFN